MADYVSLDSVSLVPRPWFHLSHGTLSLAPTDISLCLSRSRLSPVQGAQGDIVCEQGCVLPLNWGAAL